MLNVISETMPAMGKVTKSITESTLQISQAHL